MRQYRLKGSIGCAKLKIRGACPETLLERLSQGGIPFWGYEKQDELTGTLWVFVRDRNQVKEYADKSMVEISTQCVQGIIPLVRQMGRRFLLVPILLLLIIIVMYLQTHIWFIQVSGNEVLSEEEILRTLEECDVCFGTKEFDLNLVKNQMLSRLPELQFITINVQGGTAEVIVRERELRPELFDPAGPRNIVASKSGLIQEISAVQGDPQIQPGDLVEAGQMLISGVTDLEKTIVLSRAEGEIYAKTWSDETAVLPKNSVKKFYTGEKSIRISLEIGKKTINFFKSSGISYGEYDKMTDRKPLTLPGGYTLPLAVTVITLSEYTSQAYEHSAPWELLSQSLLENIEEKMVAGSILSHTLKGKGEDACYILRGTVECREEIGRAQEILD